MNAYNTIPVYPGYQPFFQPQQQPQVQTRTVDAVPVDSEKMAEDYPVSLGATQLMIAKDDSFIAVKSVSVAGQVSFDMYIRRPPAPPPQAFDPGEYIRKDEFETRLAAFLAAQEKEGKK